MGQVEGFFPRFAGLQSVYHMESLSVWDSHPNSEAVESGEMQWVVSQFNPRKIIRFDEQISPVSRTVIVHLLNDL